MKKLMILSAITLSCAFVACEKEEQAATSEVQQEMTIDQSENNRSADEVELPEHEEESRLLLTEDLSSILIEISSDGGIVSDDEALNILIGEYRGVSADEADLLRIELVNDFKMNEDYGIQWPIDCYWYNCQFHGNELFCSWVGFSSTE